MAQDQIVPAVDASPAKRTSPTENSTKRYATSRVRRSPPRKETNPLAPALRTIDRAFKFFVGDGDPKKKRAASKRL
jgi:hypothetical protein